MKHTNQKITVRFYVCIYIYKQTTVKPFFIKTETRQNVYNLTFLKNTKCFHLHEEY